MTLFTAKLHFSFDKSILKAYVEFICTLNSYSEHSYLRPKKRISWNFIKRVKDTHRKRTEREERRVSKQWKWSQRKSYLFVAYDLRAIDCLSRLALVEMNQNETQQKVHSKAIFNFYAKSLFVCAWLTLKGIAILFSILLMSKYYILND